MKIAVVGCSGSGKTHLAEQLARKHHLDHIEMDSMAFYGDWTLRPVEEFKSDIQTRIDEATTGWVTDGNWSYLDGIHTRLADQIIWIDLPRHIVMRQLIPRTVIRVLTRKRLWGTNREPFTNLYSPNPEKKCDSLELERVPCAPKAIPKICVGRVMVTRNSDSSAIP